MIIKIISFLGSLAIISQLGFFGYQYYRNTEKIKKLEKELITLEKKVKLNKKLLTKEKITEEEKIFFRNLKKRINKAKETGFYINNIFVEQKMKKKNKKYYITNIDFEAKDKESAKKLIALLILSENLYKISDIYTSTQRGIKKGTIRAIMIKGEKDERNREKNKIK